MQIFKHFAAAALLLLAGCATWTYEPTRSQKYVDDANNYVHVDYGSEKEPRASTFVLSNGVRLPFKSKLKVRVELPDGTRFVAYQRMSQAGNLYLTDDETFEYFEQGTGCIVGHRKKGDRGFGIVFQGVLCASVRNPMAEKRPTVHSGSAPQGFGRESSGPRTVEQKK